MIIVETKDNAKTYSLYKQYEDDIKKFNNECKSDTNVILKFDDIVSLSLDNDSKIKPLFLDFTDKKLLFRLNNISKAKEAIIRAVSLNKVPNIFIFDATAGLARDSFIMQVVFNNVLMFERNIAVFCLIQDALNRFKESNFQENFRFNLPKLHPLGSIKDYQGKIRPDVIYYDPMFPHREKTAKVKKEMQLFQSLIGHDDDIEDMLSYAVKLAKYKVVLKRPKIAKEIEIKDALLINQIDGGICRFDCYRAKDNI